MATAKYQKAKVALLILFITLSACSSWRSVTERTLDHVHEAAMIAREAGFPLLAQECRKVAQECRDRGDRVCEPLKPCVAKIRKFSLALQGIQLGVMNGKAAVALSQQKQAGEIVSKVLSLLLELQNQLKEMGLPL